MTPSRQVELFFRHEYGKLVAVLSCRVGVGYLDDIEDAVQSALMRALERWPLSEMPDNPTAWLYRVAQNHLLGELRQRNGRRRILEERCAPQGEFETENPEHFLAGEVRDDLLRMLFVCCDEVIPEESQLVLALKTLGGFSVAEIAHRLFLTEANVYKRLGRARERLRQLSVNRIDLTLIDPTDQDFAARLPAVHKVVYLIFTEGYLSSHHENAIRRELCAEAIRLTSLLAEHPVGGGSETSALLALMHLHSARLLARQDHSGGLLLLEEQDRTRWDRDEIRLGLEWLARSAQGETFSRFHAEAGIAAEHCLAGTFADTRWDRVVSCYELLERTDSSALHRLNRAVALAEWQGPEAALALLAEIEPPAWLVGSYLWSAVLADLYRRSHHIEEAKKYRDRALSSAPNPAIRDLLIRRLDGLNSPI